MPNQLKTSELLEWRLLTIHDMGGKGTRRAINDELKKKLLPEFPEPEIDAKISIGWYWTELKEKELVVNQGKEWQLTDKGEALAQELGSGKRGRAQMGFALQAREKRQAVAELASEAGVAETKVWLLQEYSDISAVRLQEILANWRAESSAPSGTNVVECQPTQYQKNMDVEAKAIEHILQTEPEMNWQRTPTGQPGFDLYRGGKKAPSLSSAKSRRKGAIIAWCEVKGISGPFHSVSLTRREFEEAQKRGKDYWLYVVENVGSNSIRIIRIQDPAGQTERFRFSRNWRNMAQDAAS